MQYEYLFLTPKSLEIEHQQLVDEGRVIPNAVEDEFVELIRPGLEVDPSYQTRAQALLDLCAGLEMREDYPYCEPSDLDGIRAERPEGSRSLGRLDEATLADRLHAAWLGRCAGCLLGKPVEGWRSTTMWPYLKTLNKYPLRDYFRSDEPRDVMEQYKVPSERAYIDRVSHMVEDDDTNYTVTGLAIFDKYGPAFTPENVATFWLDNLPILHTFTAERIAYRNLVNLVPPPNSASYRNPYREWIGAQIRADIWGYVAPGNPELAAEYAFRDAAVSHVKNGIYGELLFAAMIAASFVTDDLEEIIEIGLSEIPARCRLAEAVAKTVSWCRADGDWEKTLDRIHAEYGHYHGVHTINNAALVVMGLLYSNLELEPAICLTVMGGWDTDCTGATAGSIGGASRGARSLPAKWVGPFDDRLESIVIGYTDNRFSDIAERTLRAGGR